MPGSFNQVILLGRLTRGIDLKVIQRTQTSVGSFGIATKRTKGKGDDRTEETTFVDCTVWGATAETMARHLGKGDPVMLIGRLTLDEWEDKTTKQRRSKLKVTVESFQFVGGGRSGDEAAPAAAAGAQGTFEIDDEDIPF